MRKSVILFAALAACAWSSAAMAAVDETKDVPVTDEHGSIPSGTVKLVVAKTTPDGKVHEGRTLAKARIVDGKAHIHVKDKEADRDTKILVIVEDNNGHETLTRPGTLGLFLDAGMNVSAGGVANPWGFAVSPGVVMPSAALWLDIGGGAVFTNSRTTGNFFGPGTGGGVSLDNNGWPPSAVFRVGLFENFTPAWYAGVVLNVITPPLNDPKSNGTTSTGIPVTSQVVQSSLAFQGMARVGTRTVFTEGGVMIGLFIEGGFENATFSGSITAPTVGDTFITSKNLTAPVVGGGIQACSQDPLYPFCTSVEATHTFYDNTFITGVTPLSSGSASVRGETRVMAGFDAQVSFWSNPTDPSGPIR